MTAANERVTSWGVSLALHALFFLLALVWTLHDQHRVPEFIEVQFLRPEELPAATPKPVPPPVLTQASARVTQTAQPAARPAAEPPRSARTAAAAARPAPAPASQAPSPGKQQSAPGTIPTSPGQPRQGSNPLETPQFGGGRQERSAAPAAGAVQRIESREQGFAGTGTSGDRPMGNGSGDIPRISGDPGQLSGTPVSSSNLTWDNGIARNRISGAMPSFPAGADRQVQISVRFIVRPDGSIGGMTFLRKGEPRYEQAVLAAMRTWRFNALPAGVERADQAGTATFTFRLQ